MSIADRIVSDPGLENGVANLTTEKIQEVVNQVAQGRNRGQTQGIPRDMHALRPLCAGLPFLHVSRQ